MMSSSELMQNAEQGMLDPEKIQKKADILETNLFKSISKQKDPSRIEIEIDRKLFPNQVINKALVQLMPRINIKPSFYLLGLRDLMAAELSDDEKKSFNTELHDEEDMRYSDNESANKSACRTFEAVIGKHTLFITIKAVSPVPSIDGQIAKSFFEHEQSAGKLLKDGVINFKEINRYPIVNAGDKLFYITHEIQGEPGISYSGEILPIREAKPLDIKIGPGVQKIDDIDDEDFQSKGYHLQALKTGVVILDRNDDNTIRGIEISDEVAIKRLDYSTGNIGSRFTCPISAKIGVICNGFKIRINGSVQVDVSEGAHVTTNNEAHVSLVQSGSHIIALKDIDIHSASGSEIISEKGCITVNNELIDSTVQAPAVSFEKSKGLLTNNTVKANKLLLKGLFFSGVNVVYFGSALFDLKDDRLKSAENVDNKLSELSNTEKLLMGKVQIELKRMAKMTATYPDLANHLKPVIIAMKAMDFETIYREMDIIQKQNNTKPVFNARKLFEALEKIPASTTVYLQKKERIKKEIKDIDQRMGFLKIDIEGFLRKAATIKVFCGKLEDKDMSKPDFILEADEKDSQFIKVTGTYTHDKGFEFLQ